MKRWMTILGALVVLVFFAVLGLEASDKQTVTGYITDDMCGLDHSMMAKGKSDRVCTLACVKEGNAFALADRENKKVYKLDDQAKPRKFAGKKVTVTGTVDGDSIRVETIAAAK